MSELHPELRALPGRIPAEPVPAHRLVAFEGTIGVALPEPYRALLSAMDGLVVPGYPEIFSLERVEKTLAAEGMRPSAPFAYTEASVAAMTAVLAEHPIGSPSFFAAFRPHVFIGALDGCVPIADGNGDLVVLVVTGPLRGLVFRNGDLDVHEHRRMYDPASSDLSPLTFERWLPLWVETMIGPL